MNQKTPVPDADMASRCRAILKPGAYTILPRTNRVESVVPCLENAYAQVLITPQQGARFIQYEVLVQPGGGTRTLIRDDLEHFIYVLEGEVQLQVDGKIHDLPQGGFTYLPTSIAYTLRNSTAAVSRFLWTRRRYQAIDAGHPDPIFGQQEEVPAVPCDTYVEKHLIPYDSNLAYDLAFNLLIFQPGVHFGFVESHIMEHGLYMLEGRGIYWLNGDYHEVQADDFIYMAPFCPQFFFATGWETGRYLIYKDVNRDYMENT